MKSRERIIRALKGEQTDRTPFCPFLAYWWEHQADEIREKGELEFLESVGADPLFRGHYPDGDGILLAKKHVEDCKIYTEENDRVRVVTYHTSKGDITETYKFVEQSQTWFLVEHPVKEEKDFLILQHIMDSTSLEADYKTFHQEVEKLGERGLLIPIICPEMKSSFQSLLEHWVGTENMVYALVDYPEIVEDTLHSMWRVSKKAAEIAADSSSPFFLSWEDTSTTNISPQYYRDYILPEINMWCEILHRSGKRYIQHACGHIDALLEDIAGSEIDVLESVSPFPTGNVDMKRVQEVLPERIAVVGGIDPVQLLNLSTESVVEKGQELIDIMQGRGYVLANSDSCPPGVEIEKFKALAQLVVKRNNAGSTNGF